jgi:hypothetical protein
MEYDKCQSTAVNLLRYLECDTTESDSIIRNILGMYRCDAYFDLKEVRENTEKQLNKGDPSRADRLRGGPAFEGVDLRVANNVLFKYRDWYIQELTKGLSWRTWYRYQMTVNPNDFYRNLSCSAIVGFCTGLAGRRAGLGVFATAIASGAAATGTTILNRCRNLYKCHPDSDSQR